MPPGKVGGQPMDAWAEDQRPWPRACGARSFDLLPVSCLERGAEGQSRADTGSPPPVFESGVIRTNTFFLSCCLGYPCLERTNAFIVSQAL